MVDEGAQRRVALEADVVEVVRLALVPLRGRDLRQQGRDARLASVAGEEQQPVLAGERDADACAAVALTCAVEAGEAPAVVERCADARLPDGRGGQRLGEQLVGDRVRARAHPPIPTSRATSVESGSASAPADTASRAAATSSVSMRSRGERDGRAAPGSRSGRSPASASIAACASPRKPSASSPAAIAATASW